MPIEELTPDPKRVRLGFEYPTVAPRFDDQKQVDKWWFDTRTVLRRNQELLEEMANTVRDYETRIATLEQQVAALTP